MRKHESQTILAVAAFTKHLGFAVFRRGELAAFWTKQLPRPRTCDSISAFTKRCVGAAIRRYGPHLVVLDAVEPDRTRSFARAIALLEAQRVVADSSIPAHELPFAAVKRSVMLPGRHTRSTVLGHILSYYPETKYDTLAQDRSQREYYAGMFVAIAIGHNYTRANP